jgi:phosphate ABC transporter phosphate-binding protein
MRIVSGTSLLFACLLFCALPGRGQTPPSPNGVQNIFVDSFGDKPGASGLRDQVRAELRKSPKFHVVENAASADLVLSGAGETWVRSHYSLNPRNRFVNSDATAVYTGFLSVELKDKKGDTVWSYLATPHSAGSTGVGQVLARLVVKKLSVEMAEPPSAPEANSVHMTTLNGAGATFPYPVYQKWFESFEKRYPEIEIHYQPSGSEVGIKRLKEGTADFAGSDVMIGADEYFAGGKPMFLRFPSIMGAVVPVYNLPDMPRELKFTPEILAGIYLGRIRKWNDPQIVAVNRTAALPDRDIVVVHRTDGSGTSYVWTDYLSKVSAEWKAAIGQNSSPKWPAGTGAEGNEGVAKLVQDTPGAIGYVEYIYAITNHMPYGSVRNSAGKFVSPDLESILAAARGSSGRIAEDFQASITNPAGADAYPVAAFTWFVVPAQVADANKKKALKEFLQWMLSAGEREAAALGYVAIAPEVLLREQQMLDRY